MADSEGYSRRRRSSGNDNDVSLGSVMGGPFRLQKDGRMFNFSGNYEDLSEADKRQLIGARLMNPDALEKSWAGSYNDMTAKKGYTNLPDKNMSMEQARAAGWLPYNADWTFNPAARTQHVGWSDPSNVFKDFASGPGMPIAALLGTAPLWAPMLGLGGAGAATGGGFAPGSMDFASNMLGQSGGIMDVLPEGGEWLGEGFTDAASSGGGFVDTPGGAVDMGGNPWVGGSNSTFPTTPPGTGGGGSSGGGWWDTIGGLVKGLPPGTIPGLASILFGDSKTGNKGILGPVAEYKSSGQNLDVLQNALKDYTSQLKDITAQADPFRDQRPFFQNLLRQSYEDPDFMNKGPFKNWRDTTVDEAKRQASAMGWSNSPAMFDHITNRLNAQNMNYLLPFQQQVGGYAGGNINPQGAASIYANGLGTALGQIPNVIGQREQKAGARGNIMGQIPGILKTLGDIFMSGNGNSRTTPNTSPTNGGLLGSGSYNVINTQDPSNYPAGTNPGSEWDPAWNDLI